ncbi:rhodanese-like domain-containing protein [Roseomonas sp. GC11]|uniref:sulfurtransferase n=1 Tax=Roseomonas sp. GC11 TaxID=2950546 RepID=UPI00210C88CB|nr:rhodanese-like domain-containing protein [Roseomonas sp. GC11]MCQ4160345.1 rhodanese-like domain-containing protein [Roseomonas sp. GC11]
MTASSRAAVLATPQDILTARAAGEDLVILAVRGPDSSLRPPYEAAPRLPGALESSLPDDFSAPSSPREGSRPLPPVQALQEKARRWGLGPETRVVVYDHDGNLLAGRAWWVLRWAGLRHVRMLDGGFAAWAAAGLSVEHSLPAPRPESDLTLTPGHLPVMEADAAAALARSGVLLDSRIRPNYIGGPVAPGEAPRGHIPGARSLPAPENLDATGHFRPLEELRALYAAQGADGTRPVGVYCGAGVSAAHDVAVLMMLGISAPMYPGSWSAWSADPARPVAIGAEPG